VIAELTIDLGAIVRNARNLAALVAPARLAAVVKADAYGHGLVPVARALAPHVDRFCVYALEDAVALRDAGLETPIHVLGPVPASDLDVAHAADVALTLWDDGTYARQAASVARRRRRPFAIQAKIDTGVARLGLPYATAAKAVAAYAATPEFVLRGAFTHFAAAEELDSSFTDEQLARFLAATRELAAGIERHAAATAAAMLWPQTRLDLVRAGIGLYGIWPSAETQTTMRDRGLSLEPALTRRKRRLRSQLAGRTRDARRHASDRVCRRLAAQRRRRGDGARTRTARAPDRARLYGHDFYRSDRCAGRGRRRHRDADRPRRRRSDQRRRAGHRLRHDRLRNRRPSADRGAAPLRGRRRLSAVYASAANAAARSSVPE
jgi:hypothetical protein